MKKEISPSVAIVVVVAVLVILGGYWFFSQSSGGPKALPQGAPSKNVGGRRLPMPAGGTNPSQGNQ